MKLLQYLTTVQGRLTTGCALVAAIVVGLWPDHPRPVDPVRAGAIFTAAIAWLFAEIANAGTPSPHDIELFEKITTQLPPERLDFLRHHDFGFPFEDPGYAAINDIARWRGSRNEFVDKKLQQRWVTVHAEVVAFAGCFGRYTFPVTGSANFYTVHPTQGDPDNPADFVQERIDQLNTSASELVDSLDAFERFVRERLRL